MRAALSLALAITAGCASAPDGGSLPIVSRGRPYVPVEGVEKPELAARARGAVLAANGEKPIAIRMLPSREEREHAVRGTVVAIAGPARDGRFVYATRDPEKRGLALNLAGIDGRDRFVARFDRLIAALAIAPGADRAAILSPFPEDDARSRGGTLRELVLVDLETGDARATGLACWRATPAWIDGGSLACVVAAEDGARWIAVVDCGDPVASRAVAGGELAVAAPSADGAAGLLVFRGDEQRPTASRVALDGGAETALVLRGVLQPLAQVGEGLLVSFSAPTLGTEPQWEIELLGPQTALATIKLHDLATGDFQTIETRASPRKLWSAGRLDP